VDLARAAADGASPDRVDPVWIAASVAPVEDCYRPDLVPDEHSLADEHGRMMTWLADAAVDLIWIETMNTVREATAAAHAAKRAGLPFVVSFVVREKGNLLSGESLEDAVHAVAPYDPTAIGLNCIPPNGVTRNLSRLRSATPRPLFAYAHLGNPEPITGWSFSQDVDPETYAIEASKWIDQGARIVGGCCGTTPAHVKALRRTVDGRRNLIR
jgi:enediyne biosynthesis protein CalE2